jgi:DNA-binding MarR family transcriptional regulator
MNHHDAQRADLVMTLIEVGLRLEARLEEALAPLGLSLAKLNVLGHLIEAGEPLTLSEIAARLNCVRSNVTQLIDRLEADGLVRREADHADRRAVRAVITERGRESQAQGAQVLARVKAQLATSIEGSDVPALRAALARLS